MTNSKLFAAAVALATVTTVAPAAMAFGPKASSENFIPEETYAAPVTDVPTAMIGIKTSSENNIPAEPSVTAPVVAQPHYVLEGGYVNGGKWRGHWVLVQ